MMPQERYQHFADQTGEDLAIIESHGFELKTSHYESDREKVKPIRFLFPTTSVTFRSTGHFHRRV